MSTEVWFRNPDSYIRELVEVGEYHVAWDRGLLVKKRLDPVKHAALYFGQAFPYRILLIGDQGTAEIRPGDTMAKPTAVYPTWLYGDDIALLEELIEFPVGEDPRICLDATIAPDERPVLGQEHRIIITEIPVSNSGPGRSFLRNLKELQEDHPEVIIHLHGLYNYRVPFGMGFKSADIEPRMDAQKGKVTLPSGKKVLFERTVETPHWITMLNFKPADLKIPRNRCMYNIKSARWASEHFAEDFKFKVKNDKLAVDSTSPDSKFVPRVTKDYLTSHAGKAQEGDKFLCDTCSLQMKCKYFRVGSVCSVPGAEPVKLSKLFSSRDADNIIDGLGSLVAANTNRLERGLQNEDIDGELQPEVSKMMGQVFDQAVKLAKLIEPGRFSGPKVNVNVNNGGSASISSSNPRQLIASAIRELEQQGIPRDKITEEMVQGLFSGMADQAKAQTAIEGTVISSKDES